MPAGPHQIRCTEEVIDKILKSIAKGIPYKKACLRNGISERLFYMWINQGEKDLFECLETKHSNLVKKLNDIESDRIQYHLERVEELENGHKGSQWVLERVFWKYFSPKVGEIELNERVENLEKSKQGEGDGNKEENVDG